MDLSICSYNSNGLGTGRLSYIAELLTDHHFIFVQEHWLYKEQLDVFQRKLSGVNCHGVSGMDSSIRYCIQKVIMIFFSIYITNATI